MWRDRPIFPTEPEIGAHDAVIFDRRLGVANWRRFQVLISMFGRRAARIVGRDSRSTIPTVQIMAFGRDIRVSALVPWRSRLP